MTEHTIPASILEEATRQHALLSRGTVDILGGEKNGKDGLFWKLVESLTEDRPLKIKFGMDPTASDLHLGHTVVLTKMRQFQDCGHIAQPLIGDGTTLIGDPSGRNATRPLLSLEDIRENAQSYLDQIHKVLRTDDNYDLQWNGDWLLKLSYKDVVELCAEVTVARIIEREDFAKRLKDHTPISLHELLYPIAQGYDSVAMGCDIEFGGTDQTFNLLMGRLLMERRGMRPQIAMTMPLLEGTDGVEKMSKSKGNYIGVSEDPENMFGKIMSISDDIMPRYFELLTSVDLETLPEHPMDAKKMLGRILVERFHDASAATAAQEAFEKRFSQKELPTDLSEISVSTDGDNIGLLTLMVQVGFAQSNGEARRLVVQGGVKIDGTPVRDPSLVLTPADPFVLQAGKLKIAKVLLQK